MGQQIGVCGSISHQKYCDWHNMLVLARLQTSLESGAVILVSRLFKLGKRDKKNRKFLLTRMKIMLEGGDTTSSWLLSNSIHTGCVCVCVFVVFHF